MTAAFLGSFVEVVEAFTIILAVAVTQSWPFVHSPHDPPQPSSPHFRPLQSGVHGLATQRPEALHTWPDGQRPQSPPQPSVLPQYRPSHAGTQLLSKVTWSVNAPCAEPSKPSTIR